MFKQVAFVPTYTFAGEMIRFQLVTRFAFAFVNELKLLTFLAACAPQMTWM